MVMVDSHLKKYNQHNVVTQVKNVKIEALTFPTITFCLQEYIYIFDTLNGTPSMAEAYISNNFSNFPIKCSFEGRPCYIHGDFEYVPMYYQFEAIELTLSCYRFNGGKDGPLLKSTQFESYSGLVILFD